MNTPCPTSSSQDIALINDPSIDCIYNPLPNGLHYKWTMAAIKAGKHVLLEKPSASNAEEARFLFNHPILQAPNAPVVVEASHYRFHPTWRLFNSQFNKEDVEHVDVRAAVYGGAFPGSDIRYDFNLAGGAAMDLGHYTISAMRGVFGTEPTEVTSATPRPIHKPYDQRCDEAMVATYTFPNGGSGRMLADLGARGGYWFPWLTSNWPSLRDMLAWILVTLRPIDLGTENGLQKSSRKTIRLNSFMAPHGGHSIVITTTITLTDPGTGKVVKEEKQTETKKAYSWPEGTKSKGENWWATYRYQLEEFVNRVKGRDGSGAWVEHEESFKQMAVTDRTYEAAGMLLRPSSEVLE
jgi:predicted dehydrogenase